MGFFEKLKQTFLKSNPVKPVTSGQVVNEFDEVIGSTRTEYAVSSNYFWNIKLNTLSVYTDQVVNWDDKKKIALILYCIKRINNYRTNTRTHSYQDKAYQESEVCTAYLSQLFKAKIAIDEVDLGNIINAFIENKRWDWATLNRWPVSPLLSQLVRQYGTAGISAKMVDLLRALRTKVQEINHSYYEKDKLKIIEKIDQLIFDATKTHEEVKPTLFLGDDAFSVYANQAIQSLPADEQQVWFRLIAKALKASGSKPSNKYLQESKDLFKELGADKFKSVVNNWFLFVINLQEVTVVHSQTYADRIYNYSTSTFLSAINLDAIKGFVWMCAHFHDSATLNNLAKLAERSHRKMPGVGSAAAGLGNACFYALYKSRGLDGIGHLSRLKLRIKQTSTQQIIEKYIQEAANERGVSTHEIEDMAVDDFGLTNGTREFKFENHTCILEITGVGKSELKWYKADQTLQKAVPAVVKEKQAARLKKVKDLQKQTDQTTSAQRDRIDRMFRTGRKFNSAAFKEFFLNHGLMCYLTRRIIWNITQNGEPASVIWVDGIWLNNDGEVAKPDDDADIALWHPALSSIAEVKKWREFLIGKQIQQPLKQAFREVYLLTEAELNTRSYSNRMAAHVLKQHQFNILAKTRGWKYALLGAYDNGMDRGTAEIRLPEYGLKAQYWVNEVAADDAFNDAGIWNYVTTDQLRFMQTIDDVVVNLIDVPALPLSEVLRDIDLFVGVASIGNDPAWQDSGGLTTMNTYWTAYSFGELSELAKNRKEILTGLIPRLKISKVTEIRDKFVIVRGKLRTYKIHIGSTNILMEPNDQYLCIVPDRTQKTPAENLFIPFEGDAGLSVILSKAFLLADDDKITDNTITSQINRK